MAVAALVERWTGLAPPQSQSGPVESCEMFGLLVYLHLQALEVVKLLPDCSLVSGGEPSPGLVRPTVVFVSLRHLDIVVEPDDLPLPQLL